MENKKTVSEKFTMVVDFLELVKTDENKDQVTEMVEFLDERKGLHEKRNTRKNKTETKTQKENKELAKKVADFFENVADNETAYTTAEIGTLLDLNFTPQKMTAIMKLVENVEKVAQATNDKKRVGYKKQD